MLQGLKSIKVKLFLWYVTSLIIVISYFLIFIHYYSIPHSIHLLILLFIVLALAQFFAVLKITKSITYLSSKIKQITTENLDEKVTNIKAGDEIGELATSFNNLLDRLHEAFKREQQFIGDVAHELKTPLATLRSSLEIALNKKRSNEEYKKIIEGSLIETNQLSQTLKNVLDLAWSETSNLKLDKKKFSLSKVIDDLFEIAQKMAISKQIEIKLTNTPNIFVKGYKDKLARVLLNLIDNAIKYSPKGGNVELILEESPNKALITVSDSGPGIFEEDLPHIFDRFYRGPKTEKVLGSGLGLAIAKSIVNLHKGEILVKSNKNKGTIFTVVLPLFSAKSS